MSIRGWLSLAGVYALLLSVGAVAQTAVTTSGGSANTIPVFTGTTSVGNSMITQSNGNVGIGTTSPASPLTIQGSSSYIVNVDVLNTATTNSDGNPADMVIGQLGSTAWGIQNWPNASLVEGTGAGGLVIDSYSTNTGLIFQTQRSTRMNLTSNGSLGIGTTTPGAKLEVNGNIKLTSGSGASVTFADGTVQSTAWTGSLCGGDYAEAVSGAGDRASYEPGDVLVVNDSDDADVAKSSQPYSTSVAGIYSTKPGLIGRRQATKSGLELPMAMVGIVPTKVSAENGPIRRGDLLVTSSTAGYAMKGTDRSKMLGAIVGKAMGNLDSGTGMIEVLVSLQ